MSDKAVVLNGLSHDKVLSFLLLSVYSVIRLSLPVPVSQLSVMPVCTSTRPGV